MTVPVAASVVVPTYNREDRLAACLAALLAQDADTPPHEIVVVDDASRADPRSWIARLDAATGRIRSLRHEENRGRSATRNTGIRAARGEIVLLVDDDVVVGPGYVRAHLERHRQAGAAHIAVVGNLGFPAELVRRRNYARYLQSRYLGFRREGERSGIDPANLHPRFLISAVASMRRADLLEVAPFDESMRAYGCEDHVMAHRLSQAGVRIVFAPEASAVHRDSVDPMWHRGKMLETARDGIPMLLRHSPDFLQHTAYRDLLPVDTSRDSPARIMKKLALRAALNPAACVLLERWAVATDGIPRLYVHAALRALNAAWVLRGLRLRHDGRPLVVYGDPVDP